MNITFISALLMAIITSILGCYLDTTKVVLGSITQVGMEGLLQLPIECN